MAEKPTQTVITNCEIGNVISQTDREELEYCRLSFIGGFPILLMHVSSFCEEI